MAHRKHSHLVLSDKQCEFVTPVHNHRCRRMLKQNLVDRKPKAKYCYRHFMLIKRAEQNKQKH